MKYKSLELKVGVTVILAVIIFVFGLMWFEGYKTGQGGYIIQADFPMVGGIRSGDAVNVNGVEKGKVKEVILGEKSVVVKMSISTGTVIPEDSKVVLQSSGLLGERIIQIIKGSSGTPVQEGTKLEGIYEPGISETFASLSDVLLDLKNISKDMGKITRILTEGGKFKKSVDNLAAITGELKNLITKTAPDFQKGVVSFRNSAVRMDTILDNNSGKIDRIISGFDSTASKMPVVMTKVDTLTSILLDISKRLQSNDSSLGALLNDREFLDHLQDTITELENLVADVKKNPKKYFKLEIF